MVLVHLTFPVSAAETFILREIFTFSIFCLLLGKRIICKKRKLYNVTGYHRRRSSFIVHVLQRASQHARTHPPLLPPRPIYPTAEAHLFQNRRQRQLMPSLLVSLRPSRLGVPPQEKGMPQTVSFLLSARSHYYQLETNHRAKITVLAST